MIVLPRTSVTVGTSPVTTPLPTDYVGRWMAVVRNSALSPGNITAIRYRRYAIPGGIPASWETFTLSSPLLPGEVAAIRETADCSAYLDLEITASAPACTAEIEMGAPSARNGG